MRARIFLVLPLALIILSSGIIPYSFASVESEAQEDILAGCREGNVMVFRFAYNDYICVEPETAERWGELGLAKLVGDSIQVEKAEKPVQQFHPDFYGALPPPPPQKTTQFSSDESECRVGYVLVFHIRNNETTCLVTTTAVNWERLGLVDVIGEEVTLEQIEQAKQSQMIAPPKEPEEPVETIPEILLPDYPNQPSIHPDLEATNNFWYPPQIHKVNERIWVAVGYDLANSIMIEGETGLIIIDTLSTYESAKKVMNEFRSISDKPVKMIIYTHGHLDHVHGTKAFLEEGDESVEIVAHESLLDFYINENSVLGPIASVRSTYSTGAMLPEDQINMGVFPPSEQGTIGFIAPTHTFDSKFQIDVFGVNMELVHVAGESSDQIYVWLPDDETLLIGDNIYAIFPNVYTLRGAEYRDPMNYVNALDQMIPLEPRHLVPSHVKPVSGKENVLDVLISTRDATQYIYDQTIRGMNNGYTADELSHMVELPIWFEENPWLSQARGQIPWHVKQIYYGNLGWYQGDPAFLLPISDAERAQKFVDGFGGVDGTIEQVRIALDDEEYNWAAELATYVIVVDPENIEAKHLKAFALRVIGERMLSADARHWALTSALELEGKITIDPTSVPQTSPDQLAELPIEKVLKALSTKINPDKTGDGEYLINLIYSDTDQFFTLHFRNGILAVNQGLSDEPDHTLTLTIDTHKQIVSGHLNLQEAIDSKLVESIGDQKALKFWLNSIEPLRIYSDGIRG